VKNNHKNWTLTFFITAVVLPSSLLMGFYYYDPLMLFHKPINRAVTLASNMRVQAPGIINHLDYDSYIIGTSMLENTSGDEASKILGGHFANISISDGDYYERSFLLSLALKKNAKTIIYSLDHAYLNQRKGKESYPISTFSYLYGNEPSRIKFYFQAKYILCLMTWSESSKCIGKLITADRPNAWMYKERHIKRFGGLDNWFKLKNNGQIEEALYSITKSIKSEQQSEVSDQQLKTETNKAISYIEDHLITYVRSYPNAQFYFIFPPYSRISYALWHQKEKIKSKVHEEVVRYFTKKAAELDNLDVYGYEDQSFLDDIANYKDPAHYHWWVNKKMLNDIAKRKHLLTPTNLPFYLQQARSKALSFDLMGLVNRFHVYLTSSNAE
jgi:hypothetical protein